MALTRPRFYQSDTAVARIQDPITVLNTTSTVANVDVGFIINRNLGTKSNVALYWNETGTEITLGFTSNTGISDGNIAVTSYANLRAGTIYGNIGGGNAQANVFVTGSLIPSSNVSYDLGTSDKRFKSLWLSGSTIHLGSESVSVSSSGAWTFTSGNETIRLDNKTATFVDLTITGNLNLQGYTTEFDSNNLVLQDSIIQLHTTGTAPLTGDDGRDIGLKFHYYKSRDDHAFVGWANDTGYLEWYDSGYETAGNTFTGNTYGTIKAGALILANSLASTSSTTGALRVNGGAGISGNLYVGTNLVVGSINVASNLTTAATNINTLFSSATTQDANLGTATTNITNLQANVGAYETYANANLGTATTNISNLQANVGAYETWANARIQSIDANLGAATTNITALSSNAATQQTQINNIVSGANANSFAYLTTTGATVAAATTAFNSQVQSNIDAGTAYVSFVNATSGNVSQNVNTGLTYNPNTGNLTAYGLITTAGLFWANGTAFTSGSGSTYGNTQVAAYLPTYSGTINATVGQASQPNITDVGTLVNLDVSGSTYLTGFVTMDGTGGSSPQYSVKMGNADGEKLGVITRGTAGYGIGLETLKDDESGYGKLNVTASEIHFNIKNSVAATVLTNAIVVQANGIVTLDGITESSSATTGALVIRGGAAIGGNVYAGKIYTTDGLYWAGNGNVIATSGGISTTFTASTTPPASPSLGDQWYNTTTDVLYEFIANYWVDIQSPTVTSNSTSSYGNTQVAAYLVANPQGSTYSNSNVAAYLLTNTGNVAAGNVSAAAYYFANGTPFTSSSYGNTNVELYIGANLGTATTNITTLFSNAATQATSINTISANLGTATTNITTLFSNAAIQATSIDTINANLGSFQTYSNSNAATQATSINSVNANIGSYQTYANANVASIQANLGTLFLGNTSTNANLGAFQTYANLHFSDTSFGNSNVASYFTSNVSGIASTTGALNVPIGTTDQRPVTTSNGALRYNTTLGRIEGYMYSGGWQNILSDTYSVDYLIVAGGGAGAGGQSGEGSGGGGGAGGYRSGTSLTVIPGSPYTITVGAGGTGVANDAGSAGSDSSAFGITSTGGGRGSQGHAAGGQNPGNGGSGGGSGYAGTTSGTGISGQGNSGGNSGGATASSGGGGAGAAGSGGGGGAAGAGGVGLSWLNGTYYAGGGGGGLHQASASGGAGGNGGGGAGGSNSSGNGSSGTANTGGGGGGGGENPIGSSVGGSGGSGVVIIRYLGLQRGTGGTYLYTGGYSYHTFTGSGSFIP